MAEQTIEILTIVNLLFFITNGCLFINLGTQKIKIDPAIKLVESCIENHKGICEGMQLVYKTMNEMHQRIEYLEDQEKAKETQKGSLHC